MEKLVPRNHGEAVAVFRGQVIGSLVHRTLTRGQLRKRSADHTFRMREEPFSVAFQEV